MTVLNRFLLLHALGGFSVAVVFVGAMLWFDVAGLGTLIGHSSSGLLAAAILTFATGLTFGSVQMGFAVMTLGTGSDTPPRGRRMPAGLARPIPVRIPARR
ncbi:hypothetical protein [Terrihabitans sp. B22-R8]|uniref:hypothetical protein n=1 Tax=Terrihabitans sp. B22-R8 TaxID=3425128 RepID=UPI00403D069E